VRGEDRAWQTPLEVTRADQRSNNLVHFLAKVEKEQRSVLNL
jgi:hypothetical protein